MERDVKRREGDKFKGWSVCVCVWMLDVGCWMDTDGRVSFGEERNNKLFGRVSITHRESVIWHRRDGWS